MLSKVTCTQGVVIAHITTVETIITDEESVEYHSNSIKIYSIKEAHLVIVHCIASQTTNLANHKVAHFVKDPTQESNFLVGENYSAERKGDNETEVVKFIVGKALS